MGKKVKKDDKGPPDDVFEPLLVESRQAGTVVLMLESPEEEVLAKACEAIYKFTEKCDENRKTMLDLGAVDHLLRLVQSEDRIVRRNACMALGVMSTFVDVRKALRKREETIPRVVALLSPDEDTVVHEFAALCLSSLSNDFSCKVSINEQSGLEPLIRILGSHDPDVQKNSVETISLMLQDYQTRSSLRELEGFPPLLELIRSEYPVIQHQALVALERATQDGENRVVMREIEGVDKIIRFIGQPEFRELHVFAVMVLSNCLEDPETMEVVKETGGLQKLVAFITDTQPPEEEEKKGKKGEKGASRAGKKGKGDDGRSSGRGTPGARGRGTSMAKIGHGAVLRAANQGRLSAIPSPTVHDSLAGRESVVEGPSGSDDKGKSKGDAELVIPTLPEVKEHAARAITRAAKNSENRKILHEQEVEKMLIHLLDHEDPCVRVAGAQGLGVMAENLMSRDSVIQFEGLEPLIKMTKHDNPDVREAASMALANLTTSHMNNCSEIARLHGIEPIINLLADSRELAVANGAIIMTNMSSDEGLRSQIQAGGVVEALIEPLQSENTVVQSKVSLAVAAFLLEQESRNQFAENGGLENLVRLLQSGNDEVRRNASWAITVCASDQNTAMEISKLGGLEALQEVQLSSTRKNAFTDVAIDKLLDSNLSAKYALTGYLGPNNVITDGFIDVGQLKPGTKLLTVEDYIQLPVNQKRPILLINPKPEKPMTPVPPSFDDNDGKSSKSSVGRGSRGGRESKAKSRAQREKEEKQKEEEQIAQLQQQQAEQAIGEGPTVSMPPDPALLKYIEDAVERISPLPNTKHQVVALAQYVAEKMGGPIDRGQVANFSWELPLSQLKFDLKSNVVPIGMIKAGIHYHRALLFKVIADRIAVHSSLVRGEYNRAWNEVMLVEELSPDAPPSAPMFPPKKFLVDLIHQPGRLMPHDCPDAISYQKL